MLALCCSLESPDLHGLGPNLGSSRYGHSQRSKMESLEIFLVFCVSLKGEGEARGVSQLKLANVTLKLYAFFFGRILCCGLHINPRHVGDVISSFDTCTATCYPNPDKVWLNPRVNKAEFPESEWSGAALHSFIDMIWWWSDMMSKCMWNWHHCNHHTVRV